MDATLNSFEFNNDSVLKGLSIAHGMLVCITLLGFWVPMAYLYYNVLFLVAIGLAIHIDKNLHWTYQLSLLTGFTLVMDIIVLATHWPTGDSHGINGFSLSAMIVNLLLRGVTLAFAVKIYRERRQQQYQSTGALMTGYEEFPPARPDTKQDASPLAP